jgi:putative addiction module killer protein
LTAIRFKTNTELVYVVRDYTTIDGKDLFLDWLRLLRDRKAQAMVIQRTLRVANGNFGDHKSCGGGVWELRFTLGPGYRVYYALEGSRIVLLLGGGDKGSQITDIKRAKECWRDWQERVDER